jgi:hypothetical protein
VAVRGLLFSFMSNEFLSPADNVMPCHSIRDKPEENPGSAIKLTPTTGSIISEVVAIGC